MKLQVHAPLRDRRRQSRVYTGSEAPRSDPNTNGRICEEAGRAGPHRRIWPHAVREALIVRKLLCGMVRDCGYDLLEPRGWETRSEGYLRAEGVRRTRAHGGTPSEWLARRLSPSRLGTLHRSNHSLPRHYCTCTLTTPSINWRSRPALSPPNLTSRTHMSKLRCLP